MDEPTPAYVYEPQPVATSPAGRRRRRPGRRAVVIGLLLVVLAASLTAARLVAPAPQPVPHIAYVDEAGTLTVVDPTGAERTTLGSPSTTFRFPAFSPDGLRVAAIGEAGAHGTIQLFAMPGSQSAGRSPDPTIAYDDARALPFYLYWSPDGSRIAFLTTSTGPLLLRVVPTDAVAAPVTTRQGSPIYWAWLGDGRLLVHAGTGSGDFVGDVAVDGTEGTSLTRIPSTFRSPAVSRDGQWRAFTDGSSGAATTVVVERSDGSNRREIPAVGPAAIAFDPAGSRLAFLAAAEGADAGPIPLGPLRLVDPPTGAVRSLLAGSAFAFFWAPNGATIAVLSLADGPTPGSAIRARLASARADGSVLPVADLGTRVHLSFVDVAAGSVTAERDVVLGELFVAQVLPYFDQYALSHRFWAPDSSSLLLPLVDNDGRTSLTLLPADGSNPRPIVEGVFGSWSP